LDGDYQIEIRMRFVRGEGMSGIGLTFGKDYTGNEYNFNFNQDNQYKISQRYNLATRDVKVLTRNESIGHFSPNTLTVRKISSKWYFYINRLLVHQCASQTLFGERFGFTVGPRTAMEVDYFKDPMHFSAKGAKIFTGKFSDDFEAITGISQDGNKREIDNSSVVISTSLN